MMKTLCVAVVVLSLTSVCQPASLACEKLLKPLDKGPDLSGRWYVIAMSSNSCLLSAFANALFLLSAEVDITSKNTPNIYDANYKVKIYGHCTNESESFFYENNTIFDVDISNGPTGDPWVLLQSGCPDCIVIKNEDDIDTLFLLSKRTTVTAAELKEFETQTECFGASKPQVLHSDHDYKNCVSLDDDDIDLDNFGLSSLMYERLKTTYAEFFKCFANSLKYYTSFEWLKGTWGTLQSYWSIW